MTNLQQQTAGARTRGERRPSGRPAVGRRADRVAFWRAIARGLYPQAAVAGAGVSPLVGRRWFRQAGGMPPTQLAPSAPPPSAPVSRRHRARTTRSAARAGLRRARVCAPVGALALQGSRASCSAMRRRAAGVSPMSRAPRNGGRTEPRAARKSRSWRPTRRSATMCRSGWRA